MTKYLCDICEKDVEGFKLLVDCCIESKLDNETFMIEVMGALLVLKPDGTPMIEVCRECFAKLIQQSATPIPRKEILQEQQKKKLIDKYTKDSGIRIGIDT